MSGYSRQLIVSFNITVMTERGIYGRALKKSERDKKGGKKEKKTKIGNGLSLGMYRLRMLCIQTGGLS